MIIETHKAGNPPFFEHCTPHGDLEYINRSINIPPKKHISNILIEYNYPNSFKFAADTTLQLRLLRVEVEEGKRGTRDDCEENQTPHFQLGHQDRSLTPLPERPRWVWTPPRWRLLGLLLRPTSPYSPPEPKQPQPQPQPQLAVKKAIMTI